MNLDKDTVRKLVGMATDGASVLQGGQTAVAFRFRQDQPAVQVVHCMAHQLELALKDIMKNHAEPTKADNF